MEEKYIAPIFLSDRVYAYVEENKIRYQFLMVASTITEFIPVRYPIYKVNLPVLVKVYIPQTLSHKEMEERKENKFFYENGIHLNQTYVRDDSFDNLKIAKGVFADYKKLKIVSASKSPIIIEEGAFADDARIDFVCPEGFELRVISHKWKYWKSNNTLGKKEYRYAIIGDKRIFDEIDGFISHNKDEYSFVPIDSMKLPKISVNVHQMIDGAKIVPSNNPVLAEQLKNVHDKNFSFTQLLTKDDIIELLELNNLKLDPDASNGKNLFGRKSDDGKYTIVAQCKYIKDPYENEEEIHSLSETAMFKDIPIFKDLSKKYSLFNRPEMIVIKDYYMSEMMSLKSEREAQEYVVGLTKVYHEFMTDKFGEVYLEKAREFFDGEKEQSTAKDETTKK